MKFYYFTYLTRGGINGHATIRCDDEFELLIALRWIEDTHGHSGVIAFIHEVSERQRNALHAYYDHRAKVAKREHMKAIDGGGEKVDRPLFMRFLTPLDGGKNW
jgi:hypothetical protein